MARRGLSWSGEVPAEWDAGPRFLSGSPPTHVPIISESLVVSPSAPLGEPSPCDKAKAHPLRQRAESVATVYTAPNMHMSSERLALCQALGIQG